MAETLAQEVKSWVTLTGVVNRIKGANTFLRDLVFGGEPNLLETEKFEYSVLLGDREVAPFVDPNADAILVPGASHEPVTIKTANIRLKQAFRPSPLLYGRVPGTVIYNAPNKQKAIMMHIGNDSKVMVNMVTNANEYLCSQAIQGLISVNVRGGAAFKLTIPRPSSCNRTVTTFWNDADPTLPDPGADVFGGDQAMQDEDGLQSSAILFGREAFTYFMRLVNKGKILGYDQKNVFVGMLDFTKGFGQNGAMPFGSFMGKQLFYYGRTASVYGTSTDMIRSKYIELIALGPEAERDMTFGAVADLHVFEGGVLQRERFSKSYVQQEPPALMQILASRPMPNVRRPASMCSIKVISG